MAAPSIATGVPLPTERIQQLVDDEISRATRRLEEQRQKEMRTFSSSLDAAVKQACGRVDAAVEPAVSEFISSAPQTQRLVDQVSVSLSERVESRAATVVSKLAREEVANRALADAIEERLQKQIDKRIGGFYSGMLLGVAAGLAGAVVVRHLEDRRRR